MTRPRRDPFAIAKIGPLEAPTEIAAINVLAPPWMAEAACGPDDAELFFPGDKDTPANRRMTLEAKALCDSCPVRTDCLTHALDLDQRDHHTAAAYKTQGIWAGTTPRQRSRLRGPVTNPYDGGHRGVCERLAALGITSADVRTWARTAGIDHAAAGIVSGALLAQYETAHHTDTDADSERGAA